MVFVGGRRTEWTCEEGVEHMVLRLEGVVSLHGIFFGRNDEDKCVVGGEMMRALLRCGWRIGAFLLWGLPMGPICGGGGDLDPFVVGAATRSRFGGGCASLERGGEWGRKRE